MSSNVYAKKSQARPADNNTPGSDATSETAENANQAAPTAQAVVKQTTLADAPRFVAPTHGGVDILKLLTELEDQVENTRKGPLGMMLGFDEDRFHMTIMKIRANLPEEMKRASKLAREQERLVEETRENSERIVRDVRSAAQSEFEQNRAEATQVRESAKLEATQMREAARSESLQAREQAKADAARVLREADGLLAQAQQAAEREAQQILAEARMEREEYIAEGRSMAAQLVSDSAVVQQAHAQAHELRLHADAESQAVRRGADDYARDLLTSLEGVLGKATTQIQRGREMLG